MCSTSAGKTVCLEAIAFACGAPAQHLRCQSLADLLSAKGQPEVTVQWSTFSGKQLTIHAVLKSNHERCATNVQCTHVQSTNVCACLLCSLSHGNMLTSLRKVCWKVCDLCNAWGMLSGSVWLQGFQAEWQAHHEECGSQGAAQKQRIRRTVIRPAGASGATRAE